CKRNDVGPGLRSFESGPQASARRCRYHGFVSFDHVYLSAGSSQFARNHITRDLRPHQQNPFPVYLLPQALHHRLRDIFFRNDVHPRSTLFNGFPRRRTDGGNFQMPERLLVEAELPQPLPHGFHAVHAGQDEPVVRLEMLEGGVEWSEGPRFANLNKWDFQDVSSQFAEFGRKRSRLVTRPTDQDTNALKRLSGFALALRHRRPRLSGPT